MTVFQQCKGKWLVCLTGASGSDRHSTESCLRASLAMAPVTSAAGVTVGLQASAGVSRSWQGGTEWASVLWMLVKAIKTYDSFILLTRGAVNGGETLTLPGGQRAWGPPRSCQGGLHVVEVSVASHRRNGPPPPPPPPHPPRGFLCGRVLQLHLQVLP